jgi:Protein of unknwon function (DUF3310)
MTEEVNHPQHYGGDTPYEVIKVLRAWNLEGAKWFCWGNVIKYTARAESKGNLKDYEKADWYATELVAIQAELEVQKSKAKHLEHDNPLTPERPPLPKVNSHWIWKESDDHGPRCRIIVTGIRNELIQTTTIAIEGQKLPLYSTVKSNFDYDQFFKECQPWDAAAINPWDAEYKGPLKIWPTPGTEWIWSRDLPPARCRVKVTKVSKANGNEFISVKVTTRDPNGMMAINQEWNVDFERWLEATTPIPDWPYSWEKSY